MIIDVSAILREFGGRLDVNGNIFLPDTDFLGENYHFDKPLSITGRILNTGKSLMLRAVCKGAAATQCARCAKDITVPVEFTVDEILVQDDGSVSVDDEAILFSGTSIDIDDIAASNFLVNIEGKYLCSEDCRGLCPNCGADLNEGDCGCTGNDIDPGWAVLADMIKKDK